MRWYSGPVMSGAPFRTVHLRLTSTPEAPDFVQVVGDHVARGAGLDEDSLHWVSVAVRECVVNAVKHGNQYDGGRFVSVDFEVHRLTDCSELLIRVRDEGEGFELEEVADPLAPENLLRTSGRGIFLIRSFMDDVRVARTSEGMEVTMVKRGQPASPGSAGQA
jgi:serine/threonine-protein kinase RsbW